MGKILDVEPVDIDDAALQNKMFTSQVHVDDCNDLTFIGVGEVGANTQNRPSGVGNYGVLVAFKRSGNDIAQLYFQVASTGTKMLYRCSDSGTWKPWINLPYGTETGTITEGNYTLDTKSVYKYGNVVTVNLRSSAQIQPTSNAWVILGTLPEGFRPPSNMDYAGTNNVDDTYIHVRIYPNGNIAYYGFANVKVNPFLTLTFITT